jgi:hypothetical protein
MHTTELVMQVSLAWYGVFAGKLTCVHPGNLQILNGTLNLITDITLSIYEEPDFENSI